MLSNLLVKLRNNRGLVLVISGALILILLFIIDGRRLKEGAHVQDPDTVPYTKLEENLVKQSITLTNKSNETLLINFTLKTAIRGDTVVYAGNRYTLNKKERLLEKKKAREAENINDNYQFVSIS